MSAGDDYEDEDDFDEDEDEDGPAARPREDHAPEPVPPVIELADLQRLSRAGSPDLGQAVADFAAQPDPAPAAAPPAGALTLPALLSGLRGLRRQKPAERHKLAQDLIARFVDQPDLPPPPRFALPELLLDLYEKDTPAGRAALIEIARQAPLRYGLWAGLKRIYKRAEARMDAEVFGVLSWRFDTEAGRRQARDVGPGTLIYLRRRAWRFLRQLGGAVPEIYPQFAVQVLRHYDQERQFSGTWVAGHILAHNQKRQWGTHGIHGSLPADLYKARAFDEAWKRSPDPLMLLLEMAQADPPARFAIQGLRKDFPERLRSITPQWLAGLARRPLSSVHEFLIEVLEGSPEFHQGKLRALGLHDTVLALLLSPSARARTYAVEYARAHAADLPALKLCELLAGEYKETTAFAAATLKARKPRDLGPAVLGRMLCHKDTAAFAKKALQEDLGELPEAFLIDMLYGEDEQTEWALDYLRHRDRRKDVPVAFWKKVLEDKRSEDAWNTVDESLEELARFPLGEVGAEWLLSALTREGQVGDWVAEKLEEAEALPGLGAYIERIKGLVFDSRYRKLGLKILGNTKLIKPRELGLPWLLALARRADPTLHEFAHRYLLEHWKPADFSDGDGKDEREAGIARLFALATGDKEPEPVRLFAQTYLRCHHPVIGPEQPEARQLGLKPQMARAAYTAARLWPALFDARPDVRRFAAAIARAELRAWGYLTRVYELGESEDKAVRALAYDATLKAGEQGADPACTLKVEELDPARVFAMTESLRRPTREVGMELIRRHYARLGGAERLGWLMQSADREVRLFAVRLLWEKHRPLHVPATWQPRDSLLPADRGRFTDTVALQGFLRRVLFGLPPGRSMEPSSEASEVRKHVPASVAKRRVIEVVRDLAVADGAFARLAVPVLEEFTGSLAIGEWQACLAALAQVQQAHPGLGAKE